MSDIELLKMVKYDLQILNNTFDSYLASLMFSAKQMIAKEGITLNVNLVDDCLLIVMYTAYLYRKRASAETGMPRMLRYRINNRLYSEKAGE